MRSIVLICVSFLALTVFAQNPPTPEGASPPPPAKGAKPAVAPANPQATAKNMRGAKGLRFNFGNAEITEMIAAYAQATGRKFLVDPSVRGRVSVFSPNDLSNEDAFALLASSLALNGFTWLENGDTTVIMSSRNAQRSMIPVVKELPPLKPEQMVSLVLTLKHISAEEANKRLRILPSRDGEMTPFEPTNQLIVTDYVSNLYRIAKIVELVDQPAAAGLGNKKATN